MHVQVSEELHQQYTQSLNVLLSLVKFKTTSKKLYVHVHVRTKAIRDPYNQKLGKSVKIEAPPPLHI